MTNKRKQEILRRVNKSLEWQFDSYSWSDMIDDTLISEEFTEEEIQWTKEHTGYKAYLC